MYSFAQLEYFAEGLRMIKAERIERIHKAESGEPYTLTDCAALFGELADLEAKVQGEMTRLAQEAAR